MIPDIFQDRLQKTILKGDDIEKKLFKYEYIYFVMTTNQTKAISMHCKKLDQDL